MRELELLRGQLRWLTPDDASPAVPPTADGVLGWARRSGSDDGARLVITGIEPGRSVSTGVEAHWLAWVSLDDEWRTEPGDVLEIADGRDRPVIAELRVARVDAVTGGLSWPRQDALRRLMKEAIAAHRKAFSAAVRRQGKPYVADGWRTAKGGLSFVGSEGHRGQISFHIDSGTFDPLWFEGFAGALSPYLMRVVNELDPARPPPPNFVANQSQTAWQVPVRFRLTPVGERATFDPARRVRPPPVELGPDNVDAWLADVFDVLVPETQALCDDEALLAWLVDERRASSGRPVTMIDLRLAALLARHLGRDDEVAMLLVRAEEAYADLMARTPQIKATTRAGWDRRKHYHGGWSHQRFVRFLDEAPR